MRRLFVLVLGGVALGSALAMACSSSAEEAAPSRPPVPPVVVDPDAALEGGGLPDAGCTGPSGCFTCEPTKIEEFLNACTDQQCTPFDNASRLPLFKAGQPLPPVP